MKSSDLSHTKITYIFAIKRSHDERCDAITVCLHSESTKFINKKKREREKKRSRPQNSTASGKAIGEEAAAAPVTK